MVNLAADAGRGSVNELRIVEDAAAGLRGVIVIDSLVCGPAVGACRLDRYATLSELHADALRLARGATLTSVMAGLPFGGGAAALQVPDGHFDRAALFRAFGGAVRELGGRFIAVAGAGITSDDMRSVRERTRHVAGGLQIGSTGGDLSFWSARGVFHAMTAAADVALGARLPRLRVAIKGAGSVGSHLCALLVEAGADVIVADADPARAGALAARWGVTAVSTDRIAEVEADVFAPCGPGGTLDGRTIERLRARLVCGAEPNQLAAESAVDHMSSRGTAYVPDYVANAGGMIAAAAVHLGGGAAATEERVGRIASRVRSIFDRALAECRPPAAIAERMAGELLAAPERLAA